MLLVGVTIIGKAFLLCALRRDDVAMMFSRLLIMFSFGPVDALPGREFILARTELEIVLESGWNE
jgi:hypothetical protein